MIRTLIFLFAITASALAQTADTNEEQVWKLEKAYWDYVKTNDLEKYRALWHERFLGWPSVSSSPVRKDHSTDWISQNTSKGVALESYSIEQLGVHVTGDVAINHYRIKMTWSGPKPADNKTDLLRITHTWIRRDNTWQIIGGMSAPVNAEGK